MADIYIYDVIGRGFFEDGVTDDSVRDELEKAGGEDVTVHINSPGGDMFMGIAIKNQLDRYEGKVDVVVDGVAASAATLPLLSANRVTMASGSMVMIHDPWTVTAGNEGKHNETAKLLGKSAVNLAEMYAAKGKESASKFRELMQAETWLDEKEAIELGLADEKVSNTAKNCVIPSAFGYKNTPKLANLEQKNTIDFASQARQRKIDLTKAQMMR